MQTRDKTTIRPMLPNTNKHNRAAHARAIGGKREKTVVRNEPKILAAELSWQHRTSKSTLIGLWPGTLAFKGFSSLK